MDGPRHERARENAALSLAKREAAFAHARDLAGRVRERKKRGRAHEDGSTDVLAFAIDEEPVESGRSPDSGGTGPGWVPPEPSDVPTLLGDVVICPSVAWRNAPDHAGTYEDELALLVVHGILHLLGMDHIDEEEATAMEQRERELLDRYHRRGASGAPPAEA